MRLSIGRIIRLGWTEARHFRELLMNRRNLVKFGRLPAASERRARQAGAVTAGVTIRFLACAISLERRVDRRTWLSRAVSPEAVDM